MSELAMGPLPAIFKVVSGSGFWACGYQKCRGQLAVVCVDMHTGAPGLMLPEGYDLLTDGSYGIHARAAFRRAAVGNYSRELHQASRKVIVDGRVVAVIDQSRLMGHRRSLRNGGFDWDATVIELTDQDFPKIVHCPSCRKKGIIPSIRGIPE